MSDLDDFTRLSTGQTDGGPPALYSHDTSDAIAAVTASGYYDTKDVLHLNDLIFVSASDNSSLYRVTGTVPTTITSYFISTPPAAGSITLAMLNAALALQVNSTVGAGIFNYTGALATFTIPVTGALVTDSVIVTTNVNGGGGPAVVFDSMIVSAPDVVTVVLSAPPGAGSKFNYTVTRSPV